MVKRVLPKEAAALLAEGWAYLDVRSIPEFEQGHPPGAANVPLLHARGGRMAPNPDFQSVVEASFAKDDAFIRAMIHYDIDLALFGVEEARRNLVAKDPQAQFALQQFPDAVKLTELARAKATGNDRQR